MVGKSEKQVGITASLHCVYIFIVMLPLHCVYIFIVVIVLVFNVFLKHLNLYLCYVFILCVPGAGGTCRVRFYCSVIVYYT